MSVFDPIVTRSDTVVARGNNPPWKKGKRKKNPPEVDRTEAVARSDTLDSSSISSRVVVRSDKVVARSETNLW